MDYVRQKQLREFEHQKAIDDEKAEKEREVAMLRAIQEKAADKQSDIDALRAKRAFESSERKFRRREQEQIEKKARQLQELHVSRAE